MKRKNNCLFVLLSLMAIIPVFLLNSCRTSPDKLEDYEFQKEIWSYIDDTTKKPIYLTSTLPIDSADVSKLIFDTWRIETDDYPREIRLMTRVYDSLGHFITNMANPYLKDPNAKYWTGVSERLGKTLRRAPVPIDSFTVREFGANDSIPYNIVLSVDYSGSMIGVKNAIYEGTEIFVDMKMKYDNIALTTFTKEFDVKVPLLSDKNQILNIYRTKRDKGMKGFSAVLDAVGNCIDLLQNTSETDPRVVVLFSDGDDNYSKAKIGDLIEKARASKIHVFAVGFGYSQDENLRYLAQYTGGKFYKAYTKDELIAIFRDIYMSLRYYYLVSYKPPTFWGYHFVSVNLNPPGRLDTLIANGEYDTSDKYKWNDSGGVFERPIEFDFDKSDIKPVSLPIIDEIVDVMLSYPRLKIEIQGHTDNVGGVEYNNVLSDKRANVVMQAIIAGGVEARRLRARGFGYSMPKAPNDTEENRAKNRRTEFHILAK